MMKNVRMPTRGAYEKRSHLQYLLRNHCVMDTGMLRFCIKCVFIHEISNMMPSAILPWHGLATFLTQKPW